MSHGLFGKGKFCRCQIHIIQIENIYLRLILGCVFNHNLLDLPLGNIQPPPAAQLLLLELDLKLGPQHVGGTGGAVHNASQLKVQVKVGILSGEVKVDY